MRPDHAVESPTGTFIVGLYNRQLKQHQVAEVNTGGEVLRHFSATPHSQFSGVRLSLLSDTHHIAVDSRGNILVADYNRRILLLDAQLSLRRVIIDEHQLNNKTPHCLCYREQSGQLLVGFYSGDVLVFDVLRR